MSDSAVASVYRAARVREAQEDVDFGLEGPHMALGNDWGAEAIVQVGTEEGGRGAGAGGAGLGSWAVACWRQFQDRLFLGSGVDGVPGLGGRVAGCGGRG